VSDSWAETTRQVIDRAGNRCEYCRMHQSLQGATFHVEHIIPHSMGGPNTVDNLALACPSCNLGKSNRVLVPDPDTGRDVPIFNPRADPLGRSFRVARGLEGSRPDADRSSNHRGA
jgi:5-methylcytosine-specific restriction endonuclease McrA